MCALSPLRPRLRPRPCLFSHVAVSQWSVSFHFSFIRNVNHGGSDNLTPIRSLVRTRGCWSMGTFRVISISFRWNFSFLWFFFWKIEIKIPSKMVQDDYWLSSKVGFQNWTKDWVDVFIKILSKLMATGKSICHHRREHNGWRERLKMLLLLVLSKNAIKLTNGPIKSVAFTANWHRRQASCQFIFCFIPFKMPRDRY